MKSLIMALTLLTTACAFAQSVTSASALKFKEEALIGCKESISRGEADEMCESYIESDTDLNLAYQSAKKSGSRVVKTQMQWLKDQAIGCYQEMEEAGKESYGGNTNTFQNVYLPCLTNSNEDRTAELSK